MKDSVIAVVASPPARRTEWLRHVVEAGGYGLTLEDLAAMLAYGKTPI
jgi:hypothetical protein